VSVVVFRAHKSFSLKTKDKEFMGIIRRFPDWALIIVLAIILPCIAVYLGKLLTIAIAIIAIAIAIFVLYLFCSRRSRRRLALFFSGHIRPPFMLVIWRRPGKRLLSDSEMRDQQRLDRKIDDLQRQQELLNKKLSESKKQWILETRVEEKLRLSNLINDIQTQRDQVAYFSLIFSTRLDFLCHRTEFCTPVHHRFAKG
jgi:hypothetical protein